MEWAILFVGPVGAGKTQAIRTISDIDVVDTEADATDETALLKQNTTVAMDMGVMLLGAHDKVRLYGAPGQDRFDFMWDILLEQSRGVVLFIDHSRPNPVGDLAHYMEQLTRRMEGRVLPVVIGVTHTDMGGPANLDVYRDFLGEPASITRRQAVPVLETDARNLHDVKTLLLALTSMLDMNERFPARSSAGRGLHA
ncbi:ATP/GTP-binding protein [Polaromonas sp. AER18D-145]|uniref:GTP-binding protein n=1 Tax=Polaromonas sp. AER18D-145 TaxID=1977060 RepID=UPI001142824F|nr:ATP/GTP-binding protein [Polaromonas sp. AER18D-145]